MSKSKNPGPDRDVPVRRHVFDGIEEYDNRLPNWWLFTLYIMIVFSIGYWFYYAQSGLAEDDGRRVEVEMARIEASKMSSDLTIDDEHLWKMSTMPQFVDPGRETYLSLCAACHLPSLRGKSESPAAIGPDLTDAEWVHGDAPAAVYHTVETGVLEKGMPSWGPVLGTKKTAEVVAYLLSHHQAP